MGDPGVNEAEITIKAKDIVHLARNTITVFSRVEHHGLPSHAPETAQDTEARGTSSHDNHIVIGLGDGRRQSDADGGEEGIKEGLGSHGVD